MKVKKKYRELESDDDLISDLLYATVSRDVHKVEKLMQYGIDPCTPTKDGTSPIHKAAIIESPSGADIISKMLSYGADPNVTTQTGLSPLHIAAMWGRVETIDVLLDAGADVLLKDVDDMSALDYTYEAEEKRVECIDALTRYRPPVKRKSVCFLSKSRFNIDKIIGGDIVFTSSVDSSLTNDNLLSIDDVDSCVPRKGIGAKLPEKSNRASDSISRKKKSVKLLTKEDSDTKTEKQMNESNVDKLLAKDTGKKDRSVRTLKEVNNYSSYKCLIKDTSSDNICGKSLEIDHNNNNVENSDDFHDNFVKKSVAVQTDFNVDTPQSKTVLNGTNPFESTLFHSCLESFDDSLLFEVSSSHIVSSTLIEDPSLCNESVKNKLPARKMVDFDLIKKKYADPPHGYYGDISENNVTDSVSETTFNDCFWSPPVTPKLCSRSSSLKKDRSFKNSPPHTPTQQNPNSQRLKTSPSKNSRLDESVYKDCRCCKSPNRSATSSLFVPISPQGTSKSCEVLLKISVINGSEHGSQPEDTIHSHDSAFENDSDRIHDNEDQSDKENLSDVLPPFEDADNFQDDSDDVLHENLSDIATLEDENTCDTYINLDNQNPTVDLDCEATVDYSSKPFPELVQYYEERNDEVDSSANGFIEENTLNSSKMNNTYDRSVNTILLPKQEGFIEELAQVNVEYDWKDISDVSTVVSEFEDCFIVVPASISSLSDQELRERLLKAGETPGPISDTTRKLYQKYLVKLERNNYRPLKSNDKYKDYSPEMRQVLCGAMRLDDVKEDGELLESEMSLKFTHPEKHTWREGSMKTSFNYILLDPRVLNNLPERGKTMSTLEKLRIFLASIFYIGKGKKSRPYEHLYDAIKVEKDETGLRPVTNKLKMIYEIWCDGHGIVSLHMFHSVIPVEAFTREACMIEAMGLARLTNAKSGDFYGDAALWNCKKRRQLGIYILYEAMEVYLLDGERQIRQIDLVKPS